MTGNDRKLLMRTNLKVGKIGAAQCCIYINKPICKIVCALFIAHSEIVN